MLLGNCGAFYFKGSEILKSLKEFLKLAMISLLAVLLLITLFLGFAYLIGVDFNDVFDGNFILLYFFLVFLIYIPLMLLLFFIKFSFGLGKTVAKLEIEKIDFKKDKNYFRDIIKNYGILELAYIYNLNTLKKKDIVAALLNMELKDIIKIENNYVSYIGNKNKLSKSEEYILNNSISGKTRIHSMKDLTEIVKNDAFDKGLLKKNNHVLKDIVSMLKKIIVFIVLNGIFSAVLANLVYKDIDNILITILAIITFILSMFSIFWIIYFVSYIIHKINSYELTKEGNNIKKKLNGLKMFIDDFGNLNDDNKKSLELWEDYLIYSVIFQNNKIIVNEDLKDLIIIKENKMPKKYLFIIIFLLAIYILIFI